MSAATIETEAAIAKLARLLDVSPAALESLEALDAATIRTLHYQVSDVLQADDRHRLNKVMTAAKLVPNGLAATIGERWFGPILCAKLVGLVEPKRGAQYARHLSVGFMADITVRTDPRSVGDLIYELPLDSMQAIALELMSREDHLTLSHFVGHIPASLVANILDAIEDDAAIVRIARYVEDLSTLDPVVVLLPDARLIALVDAVDREDLWEPALYLFSQLGAEQMTRIASTLVATNDRVVSAALEAFERHNLWDQGLALLNYLSPNDIARIASALDDLSDELLIGLVDAIEREDLWAPALYVFSHFGAEPMTRIATTLVSTNDRFVAAALEAFERHNLWQQGLALLNHLSPNDIARIASALDDLSDELLTATVAAADEHDLWEPIVRTAAIATEALRGRFGQLVARLPDHAVARFEQAASLHGHPDLLDLLLAGTQG